MAVEVTMLWNNESERTALAARLETHLAPMANGCCLWIGAVSEDGYGRLNVKGRLEGAHRVALALSLADPVLPSLFALHSCDTPACCNPQHLSWGTNAENMRACAMRGRGNYHPLRGEAHPNAKLNTQRVERILLAIACGASRRQLAREYGVSDRTIRNIEQGRKWATVLMSGKEGQA